MMSELIYKQQAIDAIYNTFSYAYCNNCENNGKDNDSCDECHRKYQNWAASRNTIESVINALPSASTELSNDSPKLDNKNGELISRQDAIKYFAELWECIEAISDREEWEDVCVTTVNEIKSAEPQKKGKWDFMGWQMFQCSECKHMFTQDFLEGWKEYTYESHFPPFCPNCGADMREGEEE